MTNSMGHLIDCISTLANSLLLSQTSLIRPLLWNSFFFPFRGRVILSLFRAFDEPQHPFYLFKRVADLSTIWSLNSCKLASRCP